MTQHRRVAKLESASQLTEKTHAVCHPVGRYLATKKGADPDAVTYQQAIQFELYGSWASEGKGRHSGEISEELLQAGREFNAQREAKKQAYIDSLPEGVTYFSDMMRRIRESRGADQ